MWPLTVQVCVLRLQSLLDPQFVHHPLITLADTERTDPGLLKKYTTFKSYTTSLGTYPSIRTFYRPHAQADKLPSEPNPIPLLVFVHGLGGSLAQFNPLLTSLVNIAPCLGIDLPGCGLSEFSPTAWESYTPLALAELIGKAIEEHCSGNQKPGVVLIAHSMGCSLSAMLASPQSSLRLKEGIDVLGLVGLCPRASPFSEQERIIFKRVLSVPTAIFDIWRRWDRRGGPESNGVARFIGRDADIGAKKLQERFNAQSRTAVWRRMAWGMLPTTGQGTLSNIVRSGLPGLDLWATLNVPILLIGGESDQVTKPEEVKKISSILQTSAESDSSNSNHGQAEKANGHATNGRIGSGPDSTVFAHQRDSRDISSTTVEDTLGTITLTKNGCVLRTKILPTPASHALLYDPITYRTVAGNIQPFLADHIDPRLSIGWQLTYLSTEGKWDVKNLKKWSDVPPVSAPIAGIFRAMKTLRQIDDTHSPKEFLRDWKGRVWVVLDISHDSPVYDPKEFEEGGIQYYKLPTVSKIPPTQEETAEFVELVDRLRTNRSAKTPSKDKDALIGVHCHYGFNRTGFFICAYLIEREGYTTRQALEEFGAARPDGIKHEHFINTLYARYPQV